jgi:cysteine desulfurase
VGRPLYLDHHATTPVDPRVLERMLPYFVERFGNPSSRNHAFGWEAAEAVEQARAQVARLIGAHHREVIFTSGATESNNLAIKGVARSLASKGRHLVTVVTEHPSVLDSCRALEHEGWRVTWLGVRADGLVDLDVFEASLASDTVLVSVMAANNEIGVLQPLARVVELAHARGVLVHTDASQAVGKVPFDVHDLGVDLASFTAHKMYGPKGVGALFVTRKPRAMEVSPILHGGGQERGMRPGTLNVPGIVGLGACAEIAGQVLAEEGARLGRLRDRLLEGLRSSLDGVTVNGSMAHRLPQNLNLSFADIEGEALGPALGDLAVSSGSACATGHFTPSHVLTAIGLDADLARSSLRFGVGRWTTDEDIDEAVARVTDVIRGLRRVRAEVL